MEAPKDFNKAMLLLGGLILAAGAILGGAIVCFLR